MADTFVEVLSRDHTKVKTILAYLERDPNAANGIGPAQSAERGQRVDELIIDESKHEAVEEEYFWPAVRKHVANGDDLAKKAIEQETEGKKVLQELLKLDARSAGFEPLVAKFTEAAREHIAFEENEVWPKLQAALSSEQAEELGGKLAEAKSKAPTRPHPHTPPKPGVLKTAGAAAAAMDKARDAMTRRGKS